MVASVISVVNCHAGKNGKIDPAKLNSGQPETNLVDLGLGREFGACVRAKCKAMCPARDLDRYL